MRTFTLQQICTEEFLSSLSSTNSYKLFYLETFVGENKLKIAVIPEYLSLQSALLAQGRSNVNLSINSSDELIEKIVEFLIQSEGVKAIIYQKIDEVLHVWTAIGEYDEENKRREIYNQERLLMKYLKDQKYAFDFQLIRPEEIEDVVSSGGILIFKK